MLCYIVNWLGKNESGGWDWLHSMVGCQIYMVNVCVSTIVGVSAVVFITVWCAGSQKKTQRDWVYTSNKQRNGRTRENGQESERSFFLIINYE